MRLSKENLSVLTIVQYTTTRDIIVIYTYIPFTFIGIDYFVTTNAFVFRQSHISKLASHLVRLYHSISCLLPRRHYDGTLLHSEVRTIELKVTTQYGSELTHPLVMVIYICMTEPDD